MNLKIFLLINCFQLLMPWIQCEAIKKKFPNNFNFGVATAAYQIEGGWKSDGKGENIWDRFCHTNSNRTVNNANGDIACDSYHKYLEDVAMLKNLGVDFYRFSLSWSRILPSGFINKINQAGVDYYRNLIKALKKEGIEPYVTLYHWDLPQPLQELGGWPNPHLEDYFADYARLAFELFGDDVKNWMTFNEPKQTCQLGYGYGVFAPGCQSDGIGAYLCAHNVLKAHAKAYHIYDQEFRPSQKGRISIVLDSQWYEPASDSAQDKEAAERKLQFNLGWYASPIYHPDGNYPSVMIERIAVRSKEEGFLSTRLPKFTQEEVEFIKGTYDFFGVNVYTTSLAKWCDDFPIGEPSWDADTSVMVDKDPSWKTAISAKWLNVVPWGVRKLLNWIDRTYDHPEIVIAENGYPDDGKLDDQERVNYYSEYLSNILQSMLEDGVNVTAYTAWTLMDDFEWVSGYTEKFGFYQVDVTSNNRTRVIKNSAKYYKKVIRTKCLVDICEI